MILKTTCLSWCTGMPGSCSDLQCYRKSSLFRRQDDGILFGRGQYLLGDSGYASMSHLVCSYKRADSNSDREDFNMCVAKCRVTNEHCIGVLKSRWYSLREMRVQLKTKVDNVFLVRWIVMCARLHNFVINRNDLWTSEDEDITLDNGDSEDDMGDLPTRRTGRNGRPQPQHHYLQNTIMEYALQFHKEPGGCLHVGSQQQ